MNPVDTAIVKLATEALESCLVELSNETKTALYPQFKEALILRLQDKGRVHKVKRDPLKPKKSKSGFLFYCDEFRNAVREENKDSEGKLLSTAAALKILGQNWSALSEENRVVYEQKAAAAKLVYTKELETYLENSQ